MSSHQTMYKHKVHIAMEIVLYEIRYLSLYRLQNLEPGE